MGSRDTSVHDAADDDLADEPTDHEPTDDELADEMSEESFPNSDPPSTWSSAGTHDHVD